MLIKLFDSNRKTGNNSNNSNSNDNNNPQKAMEQHNRVNKTIKSENNSSSDSMGAQLNLNANNEKMAQLSDSGKFFSSVFCLFFIFLFLKIKRNYPSAIFVSTRTSKILSFQN